LTFTTINATPVWSADSKYVYYTSTDSSGSTILRKPADGSQDAEKIVSINHQAFLKGILPDGETGLLDGKRQTADANIFTIALKPGATPTAVVNTQFMEYAAAASADGRWLAYQSNESGRPEIYVRELTGAGGRWPISTGGGEEPRWSPDGTELYYRVDGQLMAVPIETSSSFHAGTPTGLFNEVYDLRSNSGQTYTVDPHGGRFLMIRPPKEDSSAHISVVVNWFEEMRRLIPSK
jgi:eukaryotic-like serine/threonine-protein kinase